MNPLTKEYVFACQLKAVPIAVYAFRRRGSLKVLLACSILEKGGVYMLGKAVGYHVLYPIEVEPNLVVQRGGWVNGDKSW